ncbi:unnamed protein product [Cladocopium goreaui]|uniref:Ankyrin repeat-containing protein DDB_G0279043 n=1 Tax=Cladocopium goreaui TaxID=2562237 RepID=A0A9P1BZJ8_9DINO|nr:unnamed protein product [Cladocopium goreaui]
MARFFKLSTFAEAMCMCMQADTSHFCTACQVEDEILVLSNLFVWSGRTAWADLHDEDGGGQEFGPELAASPTAAASCAEDSDDFQSVASYFSVEDSEEIASDDFQSVASYFSLEDSKDIARFDFLQLRDLQCGQPHPAFAGHRFCRLHHSAINQSFRRSSFLPPKAKVLEPDVRIHAPVPSGWRAFNVQGDGRCGYRALAKFLGISWTDVMQRLLPLMLAAQHTFQPHELMAFVMAMDPANPCSRAAWLSHRHILLLSQLRDWFPDGIAVRKLHAGLDFIHFQPDGDVQLASHISSASVCVLGLLSIRAPHFVLLHSTPFEKSRAGLLGRSSALPAARAMQPSSLDFAGGSFACMVPTNFEDRPLRFASAERSWSLALPEQQLVTFTLRSLLSGAHLCTVTLPVSDLWNRSLHMVLIKVIANVLQASPFHLRLFASSDVVCPTPTGPQLAPLVSVKLLRIPTRKDLADELLRAIDLNDVACAQELLFDGQCPNHPAEGTLHPLYAALNKKNVDMVRALLLARADVACRYDFGGTPLHLACRQSMPAAVDLLINANAPVDATDVEQDSALHVAAVYGDAACVRLLLAASAPGASRNLRLETPLTVAVDTGAPVAVVATLMQAAWPDSWQVLFQMDLFHICRALGLCRFPLFATCGALSSQRDCYPLLSGGVILRESAESSNILEALEPEILVQILHYALSPQTFCYTTRVSNEFCELVQSPHTWPGNLRLAPCTCQRLCANLCLRAVVQAVPHSCPYSPVAHLTFALAPRPRNPLWSWHHYHAEPHGANFWFTSSASPSPPVFALNLSFARCAGLAECPDLELLLGVFASGFSSLQGLLHLSTFPPDARNVAAAKLNINSGQCCSLASFLTHDSFQANSCDLSLAGIAPQKLTFACRQQDQICCLFGNDGSVLLQWRCVGLPKNTPLNCFVALHSPSAPLSNLAPAPSNGFRRPVRVTQARLHQGVGLARVLPCLDLCGGFWDRLPQTCQHTVLACLCALNDLVTFLQTHRAACAFLIDASQHNALVASVSPCCCTRLCLNKCIEALLSQGFPIHKKFLLGCFNPRSFPPLHRTWQTFHSVDFRHVVRMASRISPSVSTAVIELSPVLLGQSQLYLTIGMSTGPHPAAVAWPHLFSLQAPFSQRGLQLEIRDGRCNGARWCTEVERMQMHALRPIDFSRCQTFTFVCSPASVALFDSRGDLVSLCPQPWPATESNELKGFIGLRGAAPLPRPDRDTTIIQPVLTQARREALQLQPLLRIVGPHVLHIGPLTLTGGGKASGSKAGSRRPTDPRSTKAHRQDVAMPKRALIIKRKWAELILSGEKTWEVRGEPTTKRGRIAIAQAGSKQLVGEVTLAECFLIGEQPSPGVWVSTGPPSQYIWAPDNANKHCITDQSSVNYKKAYAWVMEHARKYPAPRPYTHKPGCMKWVKLDGGSVAQFSAGATSAAGNPLWCDVVDSDSTGSVSVTSAAASAPVVFCDDHFHFESSPSRLLSPNRTPASTLLGASYPGSPRLRAPHSPTVTVGEVPAISLSAALLRDDASDSSSDAWADAFLAFLSSNCRASSFFQALQNACGLRSACLAKTCAQLALTSSAWHCFFSHPKRFSSELPFSFIQDVHSHLSCAPLLLWILPAGDLLLLSDGFCEPYEGSVVDFPTIVFNSTNAWFFPVVMTLRPIVVPALSSCPAVGYLHLLVFGLAPTLLPPTENLFHCFKTTRLECVGHLKTLRDTVALSICPCILEMGQHLCGRGLSQLALVLAPAEPVDLLILDSNSCLFHVSSFHTFQRIEWGAALLRLKNPNCFLFVFIHSTKHFLQALLRVPGSTGHAEAWLGRAQPTAHAACVATVPLNLAEPTLTERLSREALTVFTPCELLTSSPDAASCTAGASGPAQMEDDSVNACIASPGNLLRGTPEDFNRAFADVYRKDPERAKLISRYILADLAPFPHEQLKNALPDVYSMTDNLAQKAGCPFEWAFLLFLPVLGTACSKARLFINEFFLVPPLLWLGLCLDSGANKSGIMTALADIVSGFEKELLQKALDEARKEAQLAEEEEDAHGAEPDEPSSKKRKTSLSKALAAIHNNKPALFSDEGSLPAIGMQMAHNGHRAIGLYDEGRFLLRALANGEGSGFNASTMSKLFNGSIWKRTVVKDNNRFSMHQTCLCLAMTFHVEEWHDFLAKDGALGMQSRFLMFHSSPRLEKADAVLEPAVYSTGAARSRGAPVLPASLLTQFVSVLTRIENVHTANAPDFDASREFIPYFFAPDALDYFREHYDAQVLTQEQSYLQDPKLFSHAGKLKSLPWRLALLLHSWARACSAADQSGTAWSRELSREVVEPAKAIFDYLSLQSQLLAPGSNLVSTLDTHDLRELAAQRYPYLITLIETDTLPTARAEAAPANSLPDASPSFTVWWEALSPDNKLYAFVAAHWVLTSASTIMVDQGTLLKKLHAKDTGVALPRDAAKPYCQNAFLLLKYCQLAALTRTSEKAAHRLRKRKPPQCPTSQVAFSNLLHLFQHKQANSLAEYAESCLTVTASISSLYAADLKVLLPPDFDVPRMEQCLQLLTQYATDARPFEHSAKILNVKSQRVAAKQVAPNNPPPLPPGTEMLAGATHSDACSSLMYPGSLSLLPAFVLAFHHADPACRASVAHALLQQQCFHLHLSERDCDFILGKLLRRAPHWLGAECHLPKHIPTRCVQPDVKHCLTCHAHLKCAAARAVPCALGLHCVEQVLLLSYSCCSCSRSYFGPWVEGKDATGARARMLVQDNPRYFCITQNIVFATAFLDQVTDILLHCGGSFRGIVNVLRPKLHMKIRTLEKHLRDSWLQYSVCKFLTNNRTSINCFVGKNDMEPWCRGLEDQVLHQFQRRWLLQHQCSKCERGILGVDGNAKVRTKLCANTDAGVWDCRPLNAHCLTGCQSAPIPGRKYCAVHLRDADPIFGCDLILQMILSFLATTATLLSRTEAGRHKSPDIVALFPLCRRTRKALSFAVSHAKLQYPVSLLSVKRIPRSRRYAFQTKTGQAFSLSSALVPTHYQQQYGQSLLEPVSRECQSKPRVGHQVQFSASEKNDACRRQWEKSRAARRSGGILAAVKECQIISAIKLVYTHESPTGVYFFLAELFEFLSAGRNVNLKTAKRKTRLRTLQQTMPLVFYDCACTLQRFMASKKRRRMSKVARTLSRLRLVIDKFHFRKGLSGCKPDGTRPFPKTWPQTHASSFPNINDSAAEQSFAFVRKIAVAARRMTPVRGLLFLASLLHARNVQLELMGIKKAELAAAKKRKFMARRNFQDAVETLPFRRPASQQL